MYKSKRNHLKWAMALLCAIALVLSTVLFFHSLTGAGLIGCSAGTSCDSVLGSRWSLLFGFLPTAVLGMSLYAALLVIILLKDNLDDEKFRNMVNLACIPASSALLGAALWFIYVQKHFIGAFCPYCMATHCCGVLLAVLLLIHIRKEIRGLRPLRGIALLVAGLAAAGLLAIVQYKTTAPYSYDSGRSSSSLPDMTVRSLPLMGPEDAPVKLTLMYDYRCSHCRKLHHILPEVLETLGNVSVSLCPTPLSTECNPYVSSDVDIFAGACTLDRCALAVWRARPEAFPVMDGYLFSGGEAWTPRSTDEALNMAASLIGRDVLEAGLSSEWMEEQFALTMELFGRTSTEGKGAIPRFIYGDRYMVPDADDAASLAALLGSFINGEL